MKYITLTLAPSRGSSPISRPSPSQRADTSDHCRWMAPGSGVLGFNWCSSPYWRDFYFSSQPRLGMVSLGLVRLKMRTFGPKKKRIFRGKNSSAPRTKVYTNRGFPYSEKEELRMFSSCSSRRPFPLPRCSGDVARTRAEGAKLASLALVRCWLWDSFLLERPQTFYNCP